MHLFRFSLMLIFAVSFFISASYSKELLLANPGDLGMDSKRLQRIDDYMNNVIEKGELAGAVTIAAKDGKVFHFGNYGLRDIGNKIPMEKDTVFKIYSMSKPVTSVAVMMLLEEGHFLLDDPVSKFIPELKNLKVYWLGEQQNLQTKDMKRQITIRHLLTHTSGLVYGFNGDSIPDQIFNESGLFKRSEPLSEKIKRLAKVPLLFQPGEQWHYSYATDVLGYLVEVVSGMQFDDFLKERIFTPLGMSDTVFQLTKEQDERYAVLYNRKDGKLEVSNNSSNGKSSEDLQFFSGGGGLLSTASDYMRFAQMLLNGGDLGNTRILSRKSVELMTTNHLAPDVLEQEKGDGFGLGFNVRIELGDEDGLGSAGEYGWGGAASTLFKVDPQENIICIFMTQRMPYTEQYSTRFMNLVYQALE